MDIIEHNKAPALVALLDDIIRSGNSEWGMVRVKKAHIRPMTDEVFLHAIHPVLQRVRQAQVFFLGEERIYVVWAGRKKSIYKQLRAVLGALPGSTIDPSIVTSYIDPLAHGEKLKRALRHGGEPDDQLLDETESSSLPDGMDEDEELPANGGGSLLSATDTEARQFYEIRDQKPYRDRLQILVVEDQMFSQKFLCEILRGACLRNGESPLIDTARGIKDAWKIYLEKAPDLVFIDLGLIDGSGHTLARAIKELDFDSCIIVVSANHYEEELSIARHNDVDDFIAKPYNKKQILDAVARYVRTLDIHAQEMNRRFR